MRIYDNRETFYQWDLNQKITSDDFRVGDEIHFGNSRSGEAPVVKAYVYEGTVVADVPNILLQKAQKIYAYHYIINDDREYTIKETIFNVTARPKPADYVYTETEVLTYVTLEERIGHLEEYGVNDAKIKKAVDQYFEENPFVFDESDPTVPEWAKAKEKPKYTADEVGALSKDTPLPPLKFVTSLDFTSLDTLVSLRSLESDTYILRGRFVPFKGSNEYITFNSQMIASVIKRNVITYIQVFYPENNTVQYYEITDSEWRRVNTDLVNMESVENKVTELVRGADDTQYPSARAAYIALSKKEDNANKVKEITAESTDEQYPSAKATFGELEKKENTKNKVQEISEFSTEDQYPSAKAVYEMSKNSESFDKKVTVIGKDVTHEQYPSAKAVRDGFVPRMKLLGDTLAEEYLGNKYHRLYCERNKTDLDGDGELDERGTYARICVTEIPIPPPDPDIYSEDEDPALLEAYKAAQYGDHISLHSIPLRTNQGDLRVPARTIEESEKLDPSNAKEFALSIAGAKRAFVPKIDCPDKNRYAYTASLNSKGESIISLIKMGANVPSTQEDLNNQPLIRRRINGAVATRKVPEADDDAASKYYTDQKFNGANKAVSYGNYSTMITAFNGLASNVYSVGQNIMIVTLDVPDLWVSAVSTSKATYTYTSDSAFVEALKSSGSVKVGYYTLSALETQKVDLESIEDRLAAIDLELLGKGLISSAGNLSKTVDSNYTAGANIDNIPNGRTYLVRVKIFSSNFPRIFTFPLYVPPSKEDNGQFQTECIVSPLVNNNALDRIHIDGSVDSAETSYVRFSAYFNDPDKITKIEYSIL